MNTESMSPSKLSNGESKEWSGRKIAITGARGSLGRSLIRSFRSKGAFVIGLTHQLISEESDLKNSPNEWVQWECGKEKSLKEIFQNIDILILNHGINKSGSVSNKAINESIEINALSTWRLIEEFERIALDKESSEKVSEVWINTSEAEIQPALSPTYEISKRLIGQLVSLKKSCQSKQSRSALRIRKIILGPFRSKLNPIGLISPDLVSSQIVNQAKYGLDLIIVTPNPITYILIPINELLRSIYFKILNK